MLASVRSHPLKKRVQSQCHQAKDIYPWHAAPIVRSIKAKREPHRVIEKCRTLGTLGMLGTIGTLGTMGTREIVGIVELC